MSLQRQGAQLRVDFSKTEPQSSAFVNVPSSVTRGAVLEQLLSLFESEIPGSARGCWRQCRSFSRAALW